MTYLCAAFIAYLYIITRHIIFSLMNRSLILPIAILFGLLFHQWCNTLVIIVPYLIFSILLLNFTAVEIKKLRLLHMTGMNVSLLLFQILVSLGGYLIAKGVGGDEIVAEGVLIAVLCPVAASSVVISCLLGANRETVTAHVILGNLKSLSFDSVRSQYVVYQKVMFLIYRITAGYAFPRLFLAYSKKSEPDNSIPILPRPRPAILGTKGKCLHQQIQGLVAPFVGTGPCHNVRSNHQFHLPARQGEYRQHHYPRHYFHLHMRHPVWPRQTYRTQIWRYSGRRPDAWTKELRIGNLDGQHLS